jgi:hypothetical protein
MRGKLLFITGGLVGYVLGARAGRQRYDQISAAATQLWNTQPVQRRVSEVREFAMDTVGDVPAALAGVVKKIAAQVSSNSKRDSGQGSGSKPGVGSSNRYGTVVNTSTPSPSNTEQSTSTGRATKKTEAEPAFGTD